MNLNISKTKKSILWSLGGFSIFHGNYKKLIVGLAMGILATSVVHATVVTFELRAVSSLTNAANTTFTTSAGVNISNNHAVTVSSANAPGATIVFGLYMNFNDVAADDTVLKAQGAVASSVTSGTMTGALAGYTVTHFNDTNTGSAQGGGAGVDLSTNYPYTGGTATTAPTAAGTSDAITDVGSTIAGRAATANWFIGDGGVTSYGNGTNSVLVGEFVMTLGAGAISGGTTLGFYVRPLSTMSSNKTAILLRANGVDYGNGATGADSGFNYLGQTTNGVTSGLAYQNATIAIVGVPEPTTYVMLLSGFAMLVYFRRRTA